MNPVDFIRTNLPLVAVPSVPEIVLHKAGPDSGLWRLAEADEAAFGAPYWAHYWGGGLALARYLLDRPETLAGRRVLDLGAGSGIVGIAVMKAGAASVLAADIDPYALAAVAVNAEANGVEIATHLGDVTLGAPPDVDLVVVGDLFYEAGLAERVTAFLDRCCGVGIAVLIGDPWREFLPQNRLRLLADYAIAEFGDVTGASKPAAVFAFEVP